MSKSLRVGLFAVIGLLLMTVTIFVIGDNRQLWDPHVSYKAAFADVAGLKPGSPVRMGGVDVGSVISVGHSENAGDLRIYVELSIVKRESLRIRSSTIARVVNKGLLGDKMIELSVSDDGSPIPPNGILKTEEPTDFQKYVAKIDALADKAQKAVDNIEVATRPLGEPQFANDLRATMAGLREIADGIAHKDGTVHRLLFDPSLAQKVDRSLLELSGTLGELHTLSADLQSIVGQVKTGPGLAHAVLYDGETSKDGAQVLKEVKNSLTAIREGNGLAHTIVYGDKESDHLMTNVRAMTDDLSKIITDVRAGKGTLGGLLVDPSIYEDIKSMVGNVERNQVLRALVRYSIKADETRENPRVGDKR